ncbi:MAG: CoA-binding protein [Desulfobulbaceae bacterium]|nr:CoA-binding protein [Desulfobulbaceae bacterium]
MFTLPPQKKIISILTQSTTIAVVGLSPKKDRPSYKVASYMLKAGYEIIPINPGQDKILGRQCYPDLLSVPSPVEVINLFRRSEHVFPFVRDSITIGAKTIWMQQGIFHEEAAAFAEQAGLTVIMDRCIKIDHNSFILNK